MAEIPLSESELPPIPYQQLRSYMATLEQLPPRHIVLSLRSGDYMVGVRERPGDISRISAQRPLEVLLRDPVSQEELDRIARSLQENLNIAITGSPDGAEELRYFTELAPIYIELHSDERLNRAHFSTNLLLL